MLVHLLFYFELQKTDFFFLLDQFYKKRLIADLK